LVKRGLTNYHTGVTLVRKGVAVCSYD
jgi:hypothetical protein